MECMHFSMFSRIFVMKVSAAANVLIAVSSLAGQVAQGCNYLREVSQQGKDCLKEMRLLTSELSITEVIVREKPDPNLHQI